MSEITYSWRCRSTMSTARFANQFYSKTNLCKRNHADIENLQLGIRSRTRPPSAQAVGVAAPKVYWCRAARASESAAIRDDKPQKKEDAQRPEFKVCKYATDAIITEGSDIGTIHKVCANPDCPIHHASKQRPATDAAFKAEQEKRRREEAIAQATGLRVLKATSDAVPVRLMKRDLLFITERLAAALDERRLAIIFRLHGIGKASGGAGDAPAKLLASFLRKADESTLGRVLVAITVLQSAHSSNESAKALREAAEFYKVDVAAITAKVKEEFAAKEKAQATRKATGKAKPSQPHTAAKKAKAA